MDTKIVTAEQAIETAKQIQSQGQNIVLVGGCFDILHIGHITFLEKAREKGDYLFIFIEHDATIKKRKGANRPINTQDDRTNILARLTMVDYIIKLPETTNNTFYDDLVLRIKPAIIATTAGDTNRSHKERQAKQINAKVLDVVLPISNKSTTKIIKILEEL